MRNTGFRLLATVALAIWATGANAQGIVTLVCSSTPNGPPAFQIELNIGGSTVSYPAPNTPAQFSDQQVVWQRPRHESGGTVITAARFTLNRITGVLTGQSYCLARDSSWCNEGEFLSYCKPGQKMF